MDTGRTDFDEVQSSWIEPALGTTACKNHAVLFWVGLGGWNKVKQLAQDGTSRDAPGLDQNQGWSEVLPAQQNYYLPGIGCCNTGIRYTLAAVVPA